VLSRVSIVIQLQFAVRKNHTGYRKRRTARNPDIILGARMREERAFYPATKLVAAGGARQRRRLEFLAETSVIANSLKPQRQDFPLKSLRKDSALAFIPHSSRRSAAFALPPPPHRNGDVRKPPARPGKVTSRRTAVMAER